MTVYEMIQELSKHDADKDVEINVVADEYRTTVQVEEDVKDGEETDVDVEFDEDVFEFDIDEYKHWQKGNVVRINVAVE